MIARMTPATMRPILAPDVIVTLLSFRTSGFVSTAGGRDQQKRDQGDKNIQGERLTVYKPEKGTSTESAADEGEQRGDENGGPDRDAATEVSTGAHGVIQVKTRLFVEVG